MSNHSDLNTALNAASAAQSMAAKRQDHMMVLHLHHEHGLTVVQIQRRMKRYGAPISQGTVRKLINASEAKR